MEVNGQLHALAMSQSQLVPTTWRGTNPLLLLGIEP
jgi:hypothetical protein